ncbi:MAG: YhfC family glutamic-type intramembrane protease [Polyangiales bacterium]|nr:YhfC family intramembrane metalloprotease [Myxococcales bacterium]
MLVAAHVFEILVMLLSGAALARLVRREPLPWALFGAGMLAFVFAEVAQMGASNLLASLQAEQLVPVPTREGARRVSFILIGVFTGLTLEPLRWFVLSRYTPGYRSQRAALLVGAGAGAMEGILMGAVVLIMLVLALVFHGETLDSLTAAGLSGRAAIKVGLRVVAWWDSSPLGAILAAAEALVRLAFQVGCTCVVMVGVRRRAPGWLLLAVLTDAAYEVANAWASDPSSGLGDWAAFGVVATGLPLAFGMIALGRTMAQQDGALEHPAPLAGDAGAPAA